MNPGENARRYCDALLGEYTRYHGQKEGMAYAVFGGYASIAIVGLTSPQWPPNWPLPAAFVAQLALFVIVLLLLRWQLSNRRLAALRVAGLERLLSMWLVREPTQEELQPCQAEPLRASGGSQFAAFFWPACAPAAEGDVEEARYPTAFVKAWKNQAASPGTGARWHEHVITAATWGLFAGLLFKTIACREL